MKLRWPHWTFGSLLLMAVCAGVVFYVVRRGLVDPWVEKEIISQIEQRTGARVELGGFKVSYWHLHADFTDLTLHGEESAGEPPLFHADHVEAGLHIVSLFGKKVALDELVVTHPNVYVRYDASGKSNVPSPPKRASGKPWQETLFDLTIGRLELDGGSVTYNDRRVPLDARGRDVAFKLQFEHPFTGEDSYVGTLAVGQTEIAAKKDAPFAVAINSRFTLHRGSFSLDEMVVNFPHSTLNVRAELPNLAGTNWTVHYRGVLALADLQTILRNKGIPDGTAEFSGDAQYAGGDWTASGYYNGHDVRMKDVWFHAGEMSSSGNYTIGQGKLVVANLKAGAFGGTVDGRLEMNFKNYAFRTETHLRGASLAGVFAALNNVNFPVLPLHWDASMNVDSVNTWNEGFKHFETKGTTTWSAPAAAAPGVVPMAANIAFDYSQDRQQVTLTQSEIRSPDMTLDFDGMLGARDSALEVSLKDQELAEWDSFITAIRGPGATPEPVTGSMVWRGRLLGPIVGPSFVGHFRSERPRFGKYAWDEVEGDMDYSPDALRLTNGSGKFGGASVTGLSLTLELNKNWGFDDTDSWSLDARIDNAPTAAMQEIAGTNYPVSGIFNGSLHGGGTHAQPTLDSDFVFSNVTAKGINFDSMTGRLHWANGQLELTNAVVSAGPGRVAGNATYRTADKYAEFNLTGSGILLERIAGLQSKALPIAGEFSFSLKGSGPITAPSATGDLDLKGLRVGDETQGAFHGQLVSDGKSATVRVTSDLGRGKLSGEMTAGLTGNLPITGNFDVADFDLDTLIEAGLHLNQLTGHSSIDGSLALKGSLRRPDSIEVDADLSKISFGYELVQLTNDGDVRLAYTANEVRVDQAHLHGTGTDLQIGGTARFDGQRPLALRLAGNVDLRLLGGLIPDLQSQGQATVNVTLNGTMSAPQITGRASVRDASVSYADFPVGLSKVNGDFVFDQSRLTFDGLTAESGGGVLKLGGNLTYGQGPMRFDVSATTNTVRIRYPTGLSWLADGTLRLSGTTQSAVITGNVDVQRLLFTEGVDVASFFAAASESSAAPSSSSPFLRNLTLDVAAQTSPGARIEWGGAQINMDGSVRLRGNWDRPVILGDVHLVGGEMVFRGNNYQLTRGDINFANPFRLDPVLNIEASTTISQYQVTIDFTGPASRLQLNYRSDPPLPDSEIVALLALGNTGESAGLMSGTSTQNYGATALLSEAISTGLGGRIEHLFGISHFSVDPFIAETSTAQNATARVTIQQQVTRDLTITYSTNAATSNQYQLIQVEYAVKRGLSVVFLRDINGTYGMDIKWVKHLK